MCIFDNSEYDNHEQVLFCRDEDAALFAIIAIHDTTLGPAAGGCRMWSYVSIEDAVTDDVDAARPGDTVQVLRRG